MNDNPEVAITKLKNGESWIWPESDYGKAEIFRIHDCFLLFEIPTYGGKPMFEGGYYRINQLIDKVNSWT
jgi:hypothetical protein